MFFPEEPAFTPSTKPDASGSPAVYALEGFGEGRSRVVAGREGDVRNGAATAQQTDSKLHPPVTQKVQRRTTHDGLEARGKGGSRHVCLLRKPFNRPCLLWCADEFQQRSAQMSICETGKRAGRDYSLTDGEA